MGEPENMLLIYCRRLGAVSWKPITKFKTAARRRPIRLAVAAALRRLAPSSPRPG